MLRPAFLIYIYAIGGVVDKAYIKNVRGEYFGSTKTGRAIGRINNQFELSLLVLKIKFFYQKLGIPFLGIIDRYNGANF